MIVKSSKSGHSSTRYFMLQSGQALILPLMLSAQMQSITVWPALWQWRHVVTSDAKESSVVQGSVLVLLLRSRLVSAACVAAETLPA